MSKRIEIWAVDFDGTLCESVWPGIGSPNKKLIDFLIQSRKKGIKLILWTCREGEKLQEAVEWCKEQGLEFDAINDNLLEMIALHGGNNCRKVWAAKYIDDLAADKEQYGIPFHGEPEPNKELVRIFQLNTPSSKTKSVAGMGTSWHTEKKILLFLRSTMESSYRRIREGNGNEVKGMVMLRQRLF